MRSLLMLLIAPVAFLASACAVSGGRNTDGSEWFFASVLENTGSEARTVDHEGMFETKTDKDQTTGAKTISNAILVREGIREGASALKAHIAKNRAVEEAAIGASSEIDILRESNRSAEVMQAATIAAETGGGP